MSGNRGDIERRVARAAEAALPEHRFVSAIDVLVRVRWLEPLRELELGEDWREACRRFATALRDITVARPASFQLLGMQPLDTPALDPGGAAPGRTPDRGVPDPRWASRELAELDANSAFKFGLDALLFGLGGPA